MNVVASLVPPLLILSLFAPGRSPALVSVAGGLLVGAGLWVGVRAALSHVDVTSSALVYHGTFRSHTVPVTDLLGLDDGDVGPLAVFTNRNGPVIFWRDKVGSTRRTTLACLPTARQGAIGEDATQSVTDDLRTTLEPYFRRNL